ncbi:MAG: Gfo/Idh/MocA family oxidoreductase [Daejeonella sp.]
MNLIIVGAGRMGMRHAIGAAKNQSIKNILLLDINSQALENAKKQLNDDGLVDKFVFELISNLPSTEFIADLAIIASPAKNRKELCKEMISKGTSHILVEKPLGQSYEDVAELSAFVEETDANFYVNLNMRLYDSFIALKNDFNSKTQLMGYKIISINTGSIGIGANGIHYLDMLYFLLDADDAEVVAGEIEKQALPSGRGPEYGDFGGWCTIKFFKNEKEVGRAHLSITAQSSVFGGWDIVAPFGHVTIDEIQQQRIDTLRKENSEMPIQRYGADYEESVKIKFNSPFLGDLTSMWIDSIAAGKSALPNISESLKVHKLMFDWLSLSIDHKVFPIT